MQIKTDDLISIALDWAVWVAGGGASAYPKTATASAFTKLWCSNTAKYVHPSSVAEQGWQIIDRKLINVGHCPQNYSDKRAWASSTIEGDHHAYGPTTLVAAMRTFVKMELGNTVEVPDDLVKRAASLKQLAKSPP